MVARSSSIVAALLFIVSNTSLITSSRAGGEAAPPPLTIEQRVAAAKAIERVFWSHRIWPDVNPTPKPALEAMISDAELRKRAEEPLLFTAALSNYWKYEIPASDLMAEIERMKRGSKDPATLRELFAALGNDTRLIAECLARPTLTKRLLRHWYDKDERVHGPERAHAAEQLAALGDDPLKLASLPAYKEITWTKRSSVKDEEAASRTAILLDDDEFTDQLRWVDSRFEPTEPRGARVSSRVSPLSETSEAFIALTIFARSDSSVRIGLVSWPKRSFDDWWSEARAGLTPNLTLSLNYPPSPIDAPTVSSSNCSPDQWTPMGGVPESRYLHSAVWTGTEMIVWGGFSSTPTSSGGRYRPATDTWVPTSEQNAPAARYRHTAIWTGTRMIVWGGIDSRDFSLRTGGIYDPASDAWEATAVDTAPQARRYHTTIWTGTEMIVWGGSDQTNGILAFNSGGRYSPSTDSWRPTSTDGCGLPRFYHTAVWTGDRMIVAGGTGYGGSPQECYSYDPVTDAWQFLFTMENSREQHVAVWTGEEMILWGGYVAGEGSGPGSGLRFNPRTGEKFAIPRVGAPYPVFQEPAVWTGSEMIVYGGSSVYSGRYSPSADSWRTLDSLGAPSGGAGITATWSGREMIVWGGYSGGRYDPGSDSWRPVNTNSSGGGTRNHTLTWTGAELVGWGGLYSSTGFRYYPMLDSWEPTTTVGAPTPRWNHTATWTGSRIFIWGGESPARLNTGAYYLPGSDSWQSIPTDGAPSPRTSHTTVWTGTRFLVWGGNGDRDLRSGGYFNDYNGFTFWGLIPTTNAPTARSHHTAVWTGDRMVIWGGDLYSNTGGRYDPITNTWTATSTLNAPQARERHTAIWTGDKMIVWGGSNGPSSLSDGGIYTPSTDLWSPISSVNTPEARARHTAVWTGKAMVIWGGTDAGTRLGSGAKYLPQSDSWQSIDESHAPRARVDHGAAWSGEQMMIWGGYTPGPNGEEPYLNVGRMYCACGTTDLTCDGKDDDCNGLFDDGYLSSATSCGVGACVASGHSACTNGSVVNVCTPGTPAPNDSSCNAVDDDCDGSIDEEYVSLPTSCGVGACARSGGTVCSGGSISDSCVAGTPAPIDANCDGVDDDCDGSVDEGCSCVNSFADADGDGYGDSSSAMAQCAGVIPGRVSNALDCDDSNSSAWSKPGEAEHLLLLGNMLSWSPPTSPGGAVAALHYDTIRSTDPANFGAGAICIETDDADTVAIDSAVPEIDHGFFYLVRARNGCPSGLGPWGKSSSGAETSGRGCP